MNLDSLQFRENLKELTFSPEAEIYISEIEKNFKNDFPPTNFGYYSHETMLAIINDAAQRLNQQLRSKNTPIDFATLREEWRKIVIDYHSHNHWGYQTQKEKPKKILTEDQKIFRELLPYFGLLLLVATISKTAFFYYGMHAASNPTEEYKAGLILSLTIFFSAMVYFGWKKYK